VYNSKSVATKTQSTLLGLSSWILITMSFGLLSTLTTSISAFPPAGCQFGHGHRYHGQRGQHLSLCQAGQSLQGRRRSGFIDYGLDTNRKATIVIEHLLQASDVSHTMQHWRVYIEWNEKLSFELYRTYKEGSDKDPSEFWYEGRSDSSTSFLALKLKTLRSLWSLE
jgi:hypothetical protein